MKNRIKITLLLTLILALTLAACSAAPGESAPADATQPATPETQPTAEATVESPALTREDAQGNVTVSVTPLNLDQPGETLDFEVALNTHSVDLSMDLAQLATLTTDDGKRVRPAAWDAPMGGHHVSGKLSFPAQVEGEIVLDGAHSLTLTLQNIDAPERVFTWQLSSP